MPSDIRNDLNQPQRDAVESIDGPVLIIAGPGSGKTRVITRRIAYLVNDCGVFPSRIAAVTFTNKAAREMRQRLFGVSPEDPKAPLFRLRDQAARLAVGTFHAFCAQVLRRDGESIGLDRNFAIYDDPDQLDVIKRSMREVEVDPKTFSPRNIQSKISGAKSQLLTADGFTMRTASYFDEVVGRVYERYEALLGQSNAADFDDLLLKTYLLLNDNDAIAAKYQDRYFHFMIDEFQDTNVAQYAIARLIAQKHRNLCVVGDPDQSIYSWRNADIRNILSFQSDFPDAKVIALEQNYRSTQTILDAASRLISANSQRVEKELYTTNGAGEPISMAEGYDEQEEAQFVLREIGSLTRPKSRTAPYRLGDIAVMYRVNAQSRALEEACRRYGVPYQVVGGMKFYQRQEVKDVAAYLRLLANPNDDVGLLRVVNLPPRGIGRRTLDELTRLARDQDTSMYEAILNISPAVDLGGPLVTGAFTARAARALGDFRQLIADLRTDMSTVNLVDLIEQVLDRSGYRKYLIDRDDQADDRLDNINEFKSAAREFLYLDMPEALSAFLESVSLVSDVDSMEEVPDALTLITLHQAKGLEYPVVFMVGMEDGLLPHARSLEENEAALEEERRLCYVGMTRAKERLYLTRAFRRGFRGGTGPNLPSRFLLDIPSELVAGHRRAAPSPSKASGTSDESQPSKTPRTTPQPSRDRSDQGFQFTRRTRPAAPSEPTKHRRSGRTAAPTSRRRKPAAGASGPPFSTGDKVRHGTFGEGIVTSCEPMGADYQVTVAFTDGGGIKRFLTSFAPLEKLV